MRRGGEGGRGWAARREHAFLKAARVSFIFFFPSSRNIAISVFLIDPGAARENTGMGFFFGACGAEAEHLRLWLATLTRRDSHRPPQPPPSPRSPCFFLPSPTQVLMSGVLERASF